MKKLRICLLIIVLVLVAVSCTACLSILDILNRATTSTNDLSNATVTLSETSYEYSGSAYTPAVTVTLNRQTLTKSTDYTVEYSNNVNAGTGLVTVTGRGSYSGTAGASFTIVAKSLNSAVVTLKSQSYTYAGSSTKAQVASVMLGNTSLVLNSDYSISYTNNSSVGTATLTINGINNYKGSVSTNFTITPLDISDAEIKLVRSKVKYDGTPQEPEISYVLVNGTYLTASDYNVTYSNNVEKSTTDPTVTITGKGNCTGTASTTFQILDQVFNTVTFITDQDEGTNRVFEPAYYITGELISRPDEKNIEKAGATNLPGYSYVWYTSSNYRKLYTFGAMGNSDITIYGKLQKEQGYSFLIYDFANADSITISTEDQFAALADYISYNYISSDAMFYQYVGSTSFDNSRSYINISSSLLSYIQGQYGTNIQKALESYIHEDLLYASTFASNGRKGVTVVMGSNNSFKFYLNYYLTNEMAQEASLSATQEVKDAIASGKYSATLDQNYDSYKTLNIDLTSGSEHELAIDSSPYSLVVTTSNQLAFALEHGAKPIFSSATCQAKKCYDAAVAVLNQICDNTMNDYQKALQIYSWIIVNVQYDYNVVTYSEKTNNFQLSQGEYWMYYDGYFLEGVFGFNNADGSKIAVCDGMSKAFTLMCQMEGINCVRVTGNVSSGRTSGGHAWNRIYINGEWYIVDPTWGGATNASLADSLNPDCPSGESVNYSYIFMTENDSRLNSRTCYSNGNWVANNSIDYFTNSYFSVDMDGNGTIEEDEVFDFYIESVDELTALWLYCIYMKDSNGDYMNIDGYTIQFKYNSYIAYLMAHGTSNPLQTALTNAKAIAKANVGFEKNFDTAYPFTFSSDNDNTYTILFTGVYTPA